MNPPHRNWRHALSYRLGLRPTTQEMVARWLDEALVATDATVLDAGCGRRSQLTSFRARIQRLVGVDIHQPDQPLDWLDEFKLADLCRDGEAFPEGTFDLALSSFTVEHFEDPDAALRTLRGWLRPGGWLVLTTVNRRHPFVNAYLSLPRRVQAPLQSLVKRHPHPLVGACNTPADVRHGLEEAGFEEIELATTDHLSRAWGRRLPAYLLGLIGDLAFHLVPSRRSTIVARARRPVA